MTRRGFAQVLAVGVGAFSARMNAAIRLKIGIGTYTYHSLSMDDMITRLTALGITTARAGSILALARAVNDDDLSLHPGAEPEATVCRLRELPGIGDWTAQYIALRALRWPDAFPVGDLGLVRAWRARSRRRLRDTAEAWRPWRAYATMYLWQSLASEGEQPCRRRHISAS